MAERLKALHARGLSKQFLGRTILDNLDLSVGEGECLTITGANGSGKTTLLRCLAGAMRPNAGTVLWFGQRADSHPQLRRLLGYVAHEPQVYRQLTARENLLFAARMTDVSAPQARVDQLLEEIGLARFAQQFPQRLSRGMLQRLTIARALLHDPHILLLDEPCTALDVAGRGWLGQWIDHLLRRGRTLCVSTHDPAIFRHLPGRVVRLQAGGLQDGPPQTKAPGQRAA